MAEIKIGIYYTEDENGKRTYDEDSMREEFEATLKKVINGEIEEEEE